jgi:hypothetical protein
MKGRKRERCTPPTERFNARTESRQKEGNEERKKEGECFRGRGARPGGRQR